MNRILSGYEELSEAQGEIDKLQFELRECQELFVRFIEQNLTETDVIKVNKIYDKIKAERDND